MSEVHYAWPWNAPRPAIATPGLTAAQEQQRNKRIAALLDARRELDRYPTCVTAGLRQRFTWLADQRGAPRANTALIAFCRRVLPRLARVTERYRAGGVQQVISSEVFDYRFDDAYRRYLATRVMDLLARFNRLPDLTKADIDLLGGDIAGLIRGELDSALDEASSELKTLHGWYLRAAHLCQQFTLTPPGWERITGRYACEEELGPAIMRMCNALWWRGRLRRIASAWREHLQIAVGNVSRRRTPYASKSCLSEWREQKRRTREFLKGMELEDEEGNRISLIDKYDASQANPAIRRCELMTRIRGFEDLCARQGYVGDFYTLTAPSAFHATLSAGCPNRHWNGASPADTQRYFASLWARIRARLHRQQIRLFGIRVAEPHHDGTPHWHLLAFMRPEEVDQVRAILRDYACEADRDELTDERAREARFHAVAIDADKGSATGYIAKYIAKNVDGYALDGERDRESGGLLKQSAAAVSAWAARWHIRQFQFIGGAPVTVYRELRRLVDDRAAQRLSTEVASMQQAADNGDWAGYVTAQGGPFVRRDALRVRLWYQTGEQRNPYGEEKVAVRGVYDTALGREQPLVTRLKSWKIVPKRAAGGAEDSACAWSSVPNCTDPHSGSAPETGIPLTRPERRRLTARLRLPNRRRPAFVPGRADERDAIRRIVTDIHIVTGETVSDGQAYALLKGATAHINGVWCRGAYRGELFGISPCARRQTAAQRHRAAQDILTRFAAIRPQK
ncbi:replication endonuclease [Siccibacter turicensis]|uniref:replication endonuclease n=1 Tax=Siccibacter turicensis TaxID=357233 RepID=UPI003F54A281